MTDRYSCGERNLRKTPHVRLDRMYIQYGQIEGNAMIL